MKKDIKWSISNENYVIKNVPFDVIEDQQLFDLDVSIKIIAIRDLMVMNEIPHEVDYEDIKDFEF